MKVNVYIHTLLMLLATIVISSLSQDSLRLLKFLTKGIKEGWHNFCYMVLFMLLYSRLIGFILILAETFSISTEKATLVAWE
ncbi:hypothetical protein MTR67_035982 [Solanum verrucosum]|uniref:Uncharacterized protein n=1 Tax=Solanum verrucosum TaxID=315347 RepID=A0AAF0UAW2_SOLVR|nr:hypothetical protein MTR67_035982 [Solanum verrucosum]